MVSFRQPNGLGLPPILRRLQETQEEIFRQLHLLMPDSVAFHDSLVSRVSGSPTLRLEVLERHPYTTFLHLTYEFGPRDDRSYAPDAHIRYYLDARMAEATSFNPVQGFDRHAREDTADGSVNVGVPAWPCRSMTATMSRRRKSPPSRRSRSARSS